MVSNNKLIGVLLSTMIATATLSLAADKCGSGFSSNSQKSQSMEMKQKPCETQECEKKRLKMKSSSSCGSGKCGAGKCGASAQQGMKKMKSSKCGS